MFDCHLPFSDAPSARYLQEKIARSATTDDKWQLNIEQRTISSHLLSRGGVDATLRKKPRSILVWSGRGGVDQEL
jgi:hypothetical protein